MRLQIFYPGGTSFGVLSDDAANGDIYDVMYTAATKEQGNGNGKDKKREYSRVDAVFGEETRDRY